VDKISYDDYAFSIFFSAEFFVLIKKYSFKLFITISIFLVIYNIVNTVYFGARLYNDPRMLAQMWVLENVVPGSKIENYKNVPRWDMLVDNKYVIDKAPGISGRYKTYLDYFSNNQKVLESLQFFENENNNKLNWYTQSELSKRNPDYIAINSLGFSRFYSPNLKRLYPSLYTYYDDLLNERYNYKIVYDFTSKPTTSLFYPTYLESLDNRMVILKRKS
jgi:hypothetical protein